MYKRISGSSIYMTSDPVGLLTEIAERIGKRVIDTNLFDSNLCTGVVDPDRPWDIVAPPGEFFNHKLNMIVAGHKVTIYANREFIVANISTSLDVDVFSINRRDKTMALVRSPLQLPAFPSFPVFSRSSSGALEDVLRSKTLIRVLSALSLGEAESLHVYRNGVILYFQPESSEKLLSALNALCRFVEELPRFSENVAVGGLPPTLEHLSSLICEWAISDDELRSEMLGQKSPQELKALIAAVEPQIAAINDYLDSFNAEPFSEAAAAVGTLCECVAEAKLIIGEG